ncbi:toprim domain-containing protein [Bacillus lumedeiriae]|uniref:toprim domain-containing protein n=1 Tax=Bacillus lumedeiriae TaxID=3058829 RepID=UPI00384D2793
MSYLTNDCKIDSHLVNWLILKDLIAQDQKKNVVFKWREKGGKGKIIGAERQGTIKIDNKRVSFKQILKNGKEQSGFTADVGRPDTIYFFESPIDLLSYWSIKQEKLTNARMVSRNGMKLKTVFHSYLEAKKEGLNINNVVLAVDNDKAGKEFIEKVKQVVNNDMLKIDIPSNEKDWNDELKEKVGNKQERKPNSMKAIPQKQPGALAER